MEVNWYICGESCLILLTLVGFGWFIISSISLVLQGVYILTDFCGDRAITAEIIVKGKHQSISDKRKPET